MIEALVLNKKTNYSEILEFVKSRFDYDFYFTENNERFYITDLITLKKLLRSSINVIAQKEKGYYSGLAMFWKSVNGDSSRNFIKLIANDEKTCRDLITVLMWKSKKEMFAKVRRDSTLATVLRNKGFRFLGGRGVQILLSKMPVKDIVHPKYFLEESDK